MKKLILLILLLASVITHAQTSVKTILPTKDTLVKTTTVTMTIASHVVYDTTYATVVKYDTLKYKVPVIPIPGGLASRPVTYAYKSNFTISGLSFDGAKGSVDLITLNNCSNVHITMCRFSNTNGISIKLSNCTNITIDYNYCNMVGFGVYAYQCSGTKVNYNQGLNLWAPVLYNGNFAHFVQYNGCYGAGQQINGNVFVNVQGVAVHAHDIITVYKSSGTPTSPIQIDNNRILGGQTDGGWPNTYDTGVGITAPDVSGSYFDIKGNTVVNSGVNGIICVGTGSNILVDGNIIINDNRTAKISYDGFTCTGTKTNITVSNNRVRWLTSSGSYTGYWFGGSSTIPGGALINNNWNDTGLISGILQTSMLTYK